MILIQKQFKKNNIMSGHLKINSTQINEFFLIQISKILIIVKNEISRI